MDTLDLKSVLPLLQKATAGWVSPLAGTRRASRRDPFHVLVSCLLSLRTKDTVTRPAAQRLLRLAPSPNDLVRLSPARIEQLIYPVGFYRRKAQTLIAVANMLISSLGGEVPDTMDRLLRLPGVGRKTANIVLTEGFGKPGIAVDTHVHRITNRWGYVQTNTAAATEQVLRSKLPHKYWMDFNHLLVAFGQAICRPTSPRCSQCPVAPWCPRCGVVHSR